MDALALEGDVFHCQQDPSDDRRRLQRDEARVGGDRANGLFHRVDQARAALEEAADEDQVERRLLQTKLADDAGGEACRARGPPTGSRSIATGSPRSASANTIGAAAPVSA